MHGLGADGNDFVPVVNELGLGPRLAVRFIFPQAPMQPVTINGGFMMRAWYDIAAHDLSLREDATGVRESQLKIENLIAREKQRGIPSHKIVLAGFSQGGAIALQTGLRHAERLAGILALSTYLPLPWTLAAEVSTANADVPIFMAHGRADPVVPLLLGNLSRQRMEQQGYKVEWHEYLMPHSVCMEEIQDIAAWLTRVLN